MISTVRGNREGFLQGLQHLYRRLRGDTIWLHVDRARWRKGKPVEKFLRTHQRLHLCGGSLITSELFQENG
jgi:acyl dehydratase